MEGAIPILAAATPGAAALSDASGIRLGDDARAA
jgi:hypothetical protein